VSAAAAPLVNAASGQMFGGYLASAVFGGLASVAGGGKFENGAITGAFGSSSPREEQHRLSKAKIRERDTPWMPVQRQLRLEQGAAGSGTVSWPE
jgi:hypothetical protein